MWMVAPRPPLEARAPRARHVPPKLPMTPLFQYSGAAGLEAQLDSLKVLLLASQISNIISPH